MARPGARPRRQWRQRPLTAGRDAHPDPWSLDRATERDLRRVPPSSRSPGTGAGSTRSRPLGPRRNPRPVVRHLQRRSYFAFERRAFTEADWRHKACRPTLASALLRRPHQDYLCVVGERRGLTMDDEPGHKPEAGSYILANSGNSARKRSPLQRHRRQVSRSTRGPLKARRRAAPSHSPS